MMLMEVSIYREDRSSTPAVEVDDDVHGSLHELRVSLVETPTIEIVNDVHGGVHELGIPSVGHPRLKSSMMFMDASMTCPYRSSHPGAL